MIRIICLFLCSFVLSALQAQQKNSFVVKPLRQIKKNVRQNLKGFGVRIKNVRYRGKRSAIGKFQNGQSVVQMSEGIILSTGKAMDAVGENDSQGKTSVNRRKGHRALRVVTDQKMYDAAALQFDFYPNSNYISFNFLFASEDYPEFSTSGLNDVVAFILTLPNGEKVNLATLPNSTRPVSVNTINSSVHPQYYINNSEQEIATFPPFNPLDTFTERNTTHEMLLSRCWDIEKALTTTSNYPVQYDGFTKVLKAQYAVIANQKHRLQIIVADKGNSIFDSAVFIEMESLHSHKDSTYQTGILRKEPNYYYKIDTLSSTRISSVIIDHLSKPTICFKQPSDLLFNYDSPELTSANKLQLDLLGKQFKECPDLNLKVIGYAGAKDNQRYNRKLSRERAEQVKIYLMQLGISSNRIDVNWQGDGGKATKKALAQNRRVKLAIFTK